MKNINKKSIILGLGILTILSFVIILVPKGVNAQSGYYNAYNSNPTYGSVTPPSEGVNLGNNNGSRGNIYNYTPMYYPNPTPITTIVTEEVTPTIYSNSTNRKAGTSSTVTKKTTTSTPANTDNTSNLAATAIYGSNGFLPSGIIGWILFAILALMIIILVRKIFGAEEDYHDTPMKHA